MKVIQKSLLLGTSLAATASIVSGCGEVTQGHGRIDYKEVGDALFQHAYGACLDGTRYDIEQGAVTHILVGRTATVKEVVLVVWPVEVSDPNSLHFELTPENMKGHAPTGIEPWPQSLPILEQLGC